MNQITRWASLLVEELEEPSYNDILKIQSVYGKTDDVMSPEEYAALPDREKEEIHRAAMTAHRDPELDNMSDEEKERLMKRSDDFLRDIDQAAHRDEKKVFVFVCESQYKPNGSEHNKEILRRGIKSREDVMRLQPGKFEIDNQETLPPVSSIEEAKTVVAERMAEMCSKFGMTLEDFKTVDAEAIPSKIRNADPNAIGFICDKSEGEGKKYERRGQQKTDDVSQYDFTYDKLTTTRLFQYIIYTATRQINMDDNSLQKMAEKFAKIMN